MKPFSRTVQKIHDQLTPYYQTYPLECALPFVRNLEDHYDELKQKWLEEIDKDLDSGALSDKEIAKIKKFKENLDDLPFALTDRKRKIHADGEIFVNAYTNLRGRKVDVIAQYSPGIMKHIDIMELELITDLLLRAGVSEINIFAPYIPYQREDKKDQGKVSIAASRMFKKIEDACSGKLGRIVTYDLHAAQAQGFTAQPVEHLSAMPLFARYFLSDHFRSLHCKLHGINKQESVFEFVSISPDAGGAKRAKAFAELIDAPYDIVDKSRPKHNEAVANYKGNIDIEGKIVIVLDDMVDTVSTLCASVDKIYSYNPAGVYFAATHALLSQKEKPDMPKEALDKMRKKNMKLVITDSIPRNSEFYKKNKDVIIDVISLARPTAYVQLLNRVGLSVSETLEEMKEKIRSLAKRKQEYTEIDKYLLEY